MAVTKGLSSFTVIFTISNLSGSICSYISVVGGPRNWTNCMEGALFQRFHRLLDCSVGIPKNL